MDDFSRKSASKTGSSTIFAAASTIPPQDRGNRQRPLLTRPGLRCQHPPGGHRPVPALPQLAGQSIEQPRNPVLLDLGQGDLVDTRCAVVPAHRDPRATQDITAEDLVAQRVEPPPGIGLGRPVKRMPQGTDRISRETPGRPRNGGTSHYGTHRAPPDRRCAPTKQRPFPSPQVVLSCGSTGTTAASDAYPASVPLPRVTGYKPPRSGKSAGHRAGEGLPSSRHHYRHVPRPIRRKVLHGCASRLFAASMAFTLIPGARHPLIPPKGETSNDAAGVA
jgi:hypothetical protein